MAPGAPGLGALVKTRDASVVVPTHDEDKHGTGLVPRVARVTPFDPAAHPTLAAPGAHVALVLPRAVERGHGAGTRTLLRTRRGATAPVS